MIDGALGDALERIESRAQDVRQAYQSGFEPRNGDVGIGGTRQAVPSMDPLTVAAPAGCYFVVDGVGGTPRYSHDGAFSLRDGVLNASDGTPVLGFSGQGAKLDNLRINAVDIALGNVADVRVESNGGVWYTRAVVDPRTGLQRNESVVVGRVALARFPAGTLPFRLDATHVSAPRGVSPHVGEPGDGNFPMLLTHVRDIGGVSIFTGLQRLEEAYLSFEALRAAGVADDGVAKTTMGLLK
jgi:hypothetical protein